MKKICFVLFTVLFITQSLHAGQRFSAIYPKNNFVSLESTFRELNLVTNSTKMKQTSYMLGLMHKGAGENRVYSEHIGFINWVDSEVDFGIYTQLTFMYRNKLPNPYTNHDILISVGLTADFEFGFEGNSIFAFGQFGPIVGLIYQIPEKGFSFYVTALFEFIFLSQIGEINLDYNADPFFGLGFGVEYFLKGTDFNLGLEVTLVRETSMVFFLGKRF